MMSGDGLKLLLSSALNLLYPPHCEFCQKPITHGFLCKPCIKNIHWIRRCCRICSLPVQGQICENFVCTSCRLQKFHFQFVVCSCKAEEGVRKLIHRFKYDRVLRLERLLSQLLFRAWRDTRILSSKPPEWLVPVPLHPLRERERGFNQSKILAEALSRHTGVAYMPFLKRTLPTRSQTFLSRRLRKKNLRDAFALNADKLLHLLVGTHVMLVDDVLTTGSTLEECSKTLLAGGVRTVSAITVARA